MPNSLRYPVLLLWLLATPLLVSCSDDKGDEQDNDMADVQVDNGDMQTDVDADDADSDVTPDEPVEVFFTLESDLTEKAFFDFPYPSDLRLTESGGPDIANIGNPRDIDLIAPLLEMGGDRPGYPVVPVAWFRFTGPMPQLLAEDLIPADPASQIHLLDVDPDSPERGTLYPVVAERLYRDPYTPDEVIAVSARQGIVLIPERTYAFVLRTGVGDADGEELAVQEDLAMLAAGDTPDVPRGEEIAANYAPLWETLDMVGIDKSTVAAATVFTTGDVIRDQLAAVSDAVVAQYDLELEQLRVPARGSGWERICEIHANMTVPEFQMGEPPFSREGGLFQVDENGMPIEQFTTEIPVVISLPKQEMPAEGFPLVMYYHGSGGIATQLIDRGPMPPGGMEEPGKGPAYVVAEHGFAMVGSAHPVNPERVPGASAIEYLQLGNLAAFRDTFRQGVIEQRLLLEGLESLRIPASVVSECEGLTLPAGETEFFFRTEPVIAMGQSMGGMYTNLISAVEPRIKASVPTGAGGFWSYFIMETTLIPALDTTLPAILQADEDLSYLHPALHLLQTAWEVSDPMVAMPRLSRRPLEGHPARPVYEPVGQGDSFFPVQLYDAVALAYGHEQAGNEVWPEMQNALSLVDLHGIVDYTVSQNLTSANGDNYTGVVVQYAGDGFSDPHSIYAQLDEVKYQYGCFMASFLSTGVAVVPAPAPLGTACPGVE